MRYKYPRTPHLPWSPGATKDDIHQGNTNSFKDKMVVVTEKMDGENTTFYSDYIHARSIDSRFHPSRAWVKALQGKIGYQIPSGWLVCGENLFAKHSIGYDNLESYFMAFSVWNEQNICKDWETTKSFLKQLEIATPKELYIGPWDERAIKNINLDTDRQEGYVVRLFESFSFDAFSSSVAKWVRTNHVTTEQHWMNSALTPNKLKFEVINQDKDS